MKILIHTDEYYPTAQACAYRMSVLANAFMDAGHEVTVVASSSNKKNGCITPQRERILYSPVIPMRKKTTVYRMLNNLSFGISSVFMALKAGKVDLVLTTSPPPLVSFGGWLIARMKRATLVYDVRDIWPDVAFEMGSFSEKSIFGKVFRMITNFMYKHSDFVTTVSPGKVTKIRSYVDQLSGDSAKVLDVGNGLDERVLDSEIDEDVIEKYKLREKKTCVYIGNIGLAQNLKVLLKIAENLKDRKDVQFLLFGSGAQKDEIENIIKKKKLSNIKICGVIPHDKVFSILSEAKISFIPLKSSKMKDSVPTKIYEALGIGCPVLLMAEGDSCDILDEANLGLHVSPDHPEEVEAAFLRMLDHYDEYDANRESARKLIREKYSRQVIATEFVKKMEAYKKKSRRGRKS